MKLDVATTVDAAAWDAAVLALGGAVAHSSYWVRYSQAAFPNVSTVYFTMRDGQGPPAAVAVGYVERSGHAMLSPFTATLRLDALPAIGAGGSEALGEFLHLLKEHARQMGIVDLSIDSYGCRGGREELESQGFAVIRRLEFELSLEKPEDELWQGLEYKRRKNINKARREGVVIRELPGRQGVPELRRLQAQSGRRILERGGPDITYRGDPAGDPVGVLLDSGCGRIIAAEVGGQIASAGLFLRAGGGVYHALSGHAAEALKSQAPTLLLWETILRYRGEGATRFNFGGCKIEAMNESSSEHGVYSYKKDFGGECIECASGSKVLRKTVKRMVGLARKALGRRP